MSYLCCGTAEAGHLARLYLSDADLCIDQDDVSLVKETFSLYVVGRISSGSRTAIRSQVFFYRGAVAVVGLDVPSQTPTVALD